MKNIMKRAWEIRREAAQNHGCKVSEINMSECLKMAWAETKGEKKMVRIELENIGSNKSWVAEITGKDAKYGLKREFLDGVRDYSRANSVKSRGVYTEFELEEGKIYEISERCSWKRTERYFVKIENGKKVEIKKDEVMNEVK